jgi:hypothetical protein
MGVGEFVQDAVISRTLGAGNLKLPEGRQQSMAQQPDFTTQHNPHQYTRGLRYHLPSLSQRRRKHEAHYRRDQQLPVLHQLSHGA